ncbi:MAG: hypothetical protein ACKODX_13110 [Gemmata sp.]
MAAPTPLSGYTPYKNLPPLAGLCSIDEATRPGLSVEECVRRLKRFHYCLKRLHQILTARVTAEPIYELKTGFAHHAHLCAEHVTALRTRISEMREPPLGLEDVPHPALEVYFDEILNAPDTGTLLAGVYSHAVGALHGDIEKYLLETNPLTDAPSRRVLKFARLELHEMDQFGTNCGAALGVPPNAREWFTTVLDHLLLASEVTSGAPLAPARDGAAMPRMYAARAYVYDPIPQRDERFTDPWNQGVNAESFLYNEAFPARAKALMMLYKRLREIDVPEMMARIITETPGKPWGYYRDMSRQLWDEARHAMMGEVGFVALGVDWTRAKITLNWSHRLNTECTPMEAHGVLYFIEQGLMPRTGKRYEFETGQASGLPLIATVQDFDWADEVLHAKIGRDWYVPQFGSLKEALDYGDAAWSKILSNWAAVKEQGLTNHENWWPAVYHMACAAEGATPDPTVLAFDETYEGKRADLQRIAAE